MTEIYLTGKDPREKAERIFAERLGNFEIKTTANGKPYLAGNPLYFSYSHSGARGLLAISDNPIGADLELYRRKIAESVLKRFTARERAEIACERDFLFHWTAREAYIKLYGLTLAELWRRVEFFGGKIYVDGEIKPVKITRYIFWCGVGAVCAEE